MAQYKPSVPIFAPFSTISCTITILLIPPLRSTTPRFVAPRTRNNTPECAEAPASDDDYLSSDTCSVDDLNERMSSVSVSESAKNSRRPTSPVNNKRRFTALDMLAEGETLVDDPHGLPVEVSRLSWAYVIINGEFSGVLRDWGTTNSLVTVWPANCHFRASTIEEAFGAWVDAYETGRVTRLIHPRSIFGIPVRLVVLQARADAANFAATENVNITSATTPSAESPALPTISSVTSMTATSVSLLDGFTHVSKRTRTAGRPCKVDMETSSSSKRTCKATKVKDEDEDESSARKDFTPAIRVKSEVKPGKSAGKAPAPGPTKGYVVIVGRNPGVFYDWASYNAAQHEKRGWHFECDSPQEAEEEYARRCA
ncbi:hypothetical protein BC835DRAFT_1424633 [Cytidiella melzeri]|nr:hypothetical protein BC835DRAFT_1424633 [Cytidiella melzeri]